MMLGVIYVTILRRKLKREYELKITDVNLKNSEKKVRNLIDSH
jgi:hypothetical protein